MNLEQIIFVTSHDLRSPLVNVQGFSQELLFSLDDIKKVLEDVSLTKEQNDSLELIMDDDIPSAIRFIKSGAEKMDQLLTGLLKLSRLGRAKLHITQLNTSEMLEKILASVQFQIKEYGVKVEVGPLPNCFGDTLQINQVFSNLIDNAIKYRTPSTSAHT